MTDEEAARELGRRVSRLTTMVTLPVMLAAFAVTVVLAYALIELQWQLWGVAEIKLAAIGAGVVGIGGGIVVARMIRRMMLAMRRPAWIDELSENHKSRREELEQIASLWR